MLSKLNQVLGKLLSRIFDAVGILLSDIWGILAPPLSWVLGEWSAPQWALRLLQVGQWALNLSVRYASVTLFLVLALGLGVWLTPGGGQLEQTWRALAPNWANVGLVADRISQEVAKTFGGDFSVQAPGPTDLANQGAPQPVIVTFNNPVAPQLRIGHEAQDLSMTPAAAGKWTWVSATQLKFEPAEEWPIGQSYRVKFGAKTMAAHIQLKDDNFDFRTASFKVNLDSAEFYQDPTQANVRRIVFQVSFTHPVDTRAFESRVHLDAGDARKFTVTYDPYKLQASVQSEPLPIPATSTAMRIRLDSGITAQRGGPGSGDAIERSVDVPGLYSLAINQISASIVSNEAGDPEHVLHISPSMPVHEREMNAKVQAWLLPREAPADAPADTRNNAVYAWSDPAQVTDAVLQRASSLKLELVAGERETNDVTAFRMPQAESGRFVLVRVSKGLQTAGGYQLGSDRQEIVRIATFSPELSIMSRGSLLALSGEKKLPLLVRDLPGVKLELARMLPQQLHLLASRSDGEFSRPSFYRGITPDHLAERFERKIALNLRPGKTHYETVDFAQYMKSEGGSDRRGVFLLTVQGYDPQQDSAARRAAQRAWTPSDEDGDGDASRDAQDEGGEGEGQNDGGEFDSANQHAPQIDPSQIRDQRLVIVTDLGLVAKTSADGSRDLFVQSIVSGAPVAGATVEVWGNNGLVLTSSTTNASGHARLPNLDGYRREKRPVLLVARKDGDLSFLPLGRSDRLLDTSRFDVGGLRSAGVPNQITAYLFSDRGIYRPGDTVHVGIIVKAANWATQLTDMPVEAEVIDARGLSVRRDVLRLGPGGAAELSHTTQDSSPTGNYTINLSLPRQSSPGAPDVPALQLGSTTVQVQEFLPDRTKVSAQMSSVVDEGWVSPHDLKLKVNVQNLFGTPAQNRRIEGRLTLSPTYPSFRSYPDYSFYDPQTGKRAQTDELGSVQSDSAGLAEFDLRLSRFESATYMAHVWVKAFEPEGGRSVSAETRTMVSDRPYLIGVKAGDDLSYINRGAKREAQLIAIDPRAKKLAVSDLVLQRVERRTLSVLVKQNNGLYRYESRAKDITLEETPLHLSASGSNIVLNTSAPGNFAYHVKDASGLVLNRIEYAVTGAANLTRALDRNAELLIKLNKKDYQAGESIELSIQAPYTGAGLITIERDKVYTHAWFKADKTASVQRITLPKDFEGNGYVSVQFMRDPASDEIYASPLSYGIAPFATSLAKRTASIQLQATELLKPGQTMKIRLRSETPVQAMVFAVDEGILQVARYNTPNPLSHFFQKRALEVGTLQTLDLLLPEFRKLMQGAAPGGDAAGTTGKHLNPFKRKRDKPVAYWSGVVEVDGNKEFSYTVPDNYNGSLRVMAVAVNDDAVAAASTQAVVRGDIVLLPTIPTSMSPGDTVSIGVGVANNIQGSGADAPIRVSLAVNSGLEVVGQATQTLKINERGEGSAVFQVRAKPGAQAQLGSASVVFTATHARAQAKLSTDLSVRPASAFVTFVQSGTAIGSGELKSQADLYPSFWRSDLAISATPWSFASALMQYLEAYPHGCTEQITSQTFPTVVLSSQPDLVRELARARGGERPAKRFDPGVVLGRYLTQLRARQNSDGGFALWPGNGSSEFATVYAVQLLVEARERKLAVPPDLLSRANVYMQSQLGAGDGSDYAWRTRTQMAYWLTRQGVMVPAALANLRQVLLAPQSEPQSSESLRKRSHKRYSQNANYRFDVDLGAAYLAASYQLLKQDSEAQALLRPVWAEMQDRVQRRVQRNVWGSYYDPLVHDSMLIYLSAKHFPDRLRSLPLATWDLMSQMIGQGWYNSQSSASIILAVDAVAGTTAAAAQGKLQVSTLDSSGKEKALLLSGELRLLAQALVPAGSTRVKLANAGGLPLFYAWAESGYERNLPEQADYHGLEVTHVVLNSQGQAISEAALGDEVTVKITIRSTDRESVPQVALVDLLPAGLEPVLQSGVGEEGDDQPIWRRRLGGSGSWNLEYADIREDRVILYGDVGRTAQDITYRARATNIGQYSMPAAYAEAMYERRLFGRSAAGRFTVVAAGR